MKSKRLTDHDPISDASIAVAWLNAARTAAEDAYNRVLEFRHELERYSALLHLLEGHKIPAPQEIKTVAELQDFQLLAELRALQGKINEFMSMYSLIPVMACDASTGVCKFNVVPKTAGDFIIEVSDGKLKVRVSEAVAVCALGRLAGNRELFKVRLCEQCQKRWRVSERKMDRFCPGRKCREKFYGSQLEVKARHARSQAKYRRASRKKIKS